MYKIYSLLLPVVIICCSIFSLNAQQWEQKANLPNNLGFHHPVTFGIGDYGYLTTGTTASSNVTKFMFKYDPVNDEWIQLSDFPGTSRSFSIAAVYNDKAYMAFGLSLTSFLNDLWEFDPVTETWKELANCPCAGRRHPAFIARDGKLYAGLGDGAAGNLNDWWVYDIATDSWSQQPNLPGPVRHHPFMFKAGDHVYAGMGHGGNNIYADWYEFDVVNNTWNVMNNFPGEARVAGTQFDFGGYGYVLSGDGDDHSFMSEGEFWKYDPFNDTWEQLESHPGISRWAPNSFVVNNNVYFTGGQNRISGFINGDLWAYPLGPAASTNEISNAENISIYPNPTANFVTVNSSKIVTAHLTDLAGKMVLTSNLIQNKTIDLQSVPKGVYILNLVNEKGKIQQEKIIKQ